MRVEGLGFRVLGFLAPKQRLARPQPPPTHPPATPPTQTPHPNPILKLVLLRGRRLEPEALKFRVQGSGFRVQGSGFRVQGLGLRVRVYIGRMRGITLVTKNLLRYSSLCEKKPLTPQTQYQKFMWQP